MKRIFLIALAWLIAAIPALSLNYSINLMWLNQQKNPQEKYVFPDKYEKTEIKDNIREWAEKNPKAPLHFLYNSTKVTPEQVKNTEDLFDGLNTALNRTAENHISLRDIQSEELVKQHPEVFNNDDVGIYFLTDDLRINNAIEELKACSDTCYSVYADLSVKPMNEEELFDDNTMMKLGRFGAIFAKGPKTGALGTLNLEHIFHIISNNKPKMLEALKQIVIDLNVERAINAIEGKLDTPIKPQTKTLEQLVFFSIPRLFEYFYHLEGLGQLVKNGIKYDKSTHGAEIFDTTHPSTSWKAGWEFKPIDPTIWNEELGEIRIPAKRVISTRVRQLQEIPATNDVKVVPITAIPAAPAVK